VNEVMMVPVQELNQLQDYYKGKLTENALLNKAGRLVAEEHLILNDPNIPASMAVKMVKPIAREEGKLVKRLRPGTPGRESVEKNFERRQQGPSRSHHHQRGTHFVQEEKR